MGILYIVGTPIGNLEDITKRALRILSEVDLILCEDTRNTKVLLDHYQIKTPTLSYHQHSRLKKTEDIANFLREGKIDWIETDHAPHTLDEKIKKPWMSGIPGLAWWPLFDEILRKNEFSDAEVIKLTHSNVAQRFNIDIKKTKRKMIDRRKDYPFDPYRHFSEDLKW